MNPQPISRPQHASVALRARVRTGVQPGRVDGHDQRALRTRRDDEQHPQARASGAEVRVATRVRVDRDDGDLRLHLQVKARLDSRLGDRPGDEAERGVQRIKVKIDARIDLERRAGALAGEDDARVGALQAGFGDRVSELLDGFRSADGLDGGGLLGGLRLAFDLFEAALGAVLGGRAEPARALASDGTQSDGTQSDGTQAGALAAASASSAAGAADASGAPSSNAPAGGATPAASTPAEAPAAALEPEIVAPETPGPDTSAPQAGAPNTFEGLLAALRGIFEDGLDELGLLLASLDSGTSLDARLSLTASSSSVQLHIAAAYRATPTNDSDRPLSLTA